jgi:hypothetical protein
MTGDINEKLPPGGGNLIEVSVRVYFSFDEGDTAEADGRT